MELLGNLGIDWKLLIAQMVNFGLLLWLLTKFLYTPIIKRIEKDEDELKQARVQKIELEKEKGIYAQEKKNEIIAARRRSREIINEAEEMAKEIERRAKKEAQQEKQAVIKQIRSRLAEIEHGEKFKK